MNARLCMAAAAAALGGFAAGWTVSPGSHPPMVAQVGAHVAPELEGILGSAATGTEVVYGGDRVRLIATVKTEDGTLCREFELDALSTGQTTAGIACRDQNHWRLDIAVAAAAAESGFAPASSLTALDSYLSAIGASEPLSPEEEFSILLSRTATTG